MILDDITQSISVAAAEAVATGDLTFSSWFTDPDKLILPEDPRVTLRGSFSDDAAEIIPAPEKNTTNEVVYIRQVREMYAINTDTISHTVLFNFSSSEGLLDVLLFRAVLGVNERVQYTEQFGWEIYSADGLKKNDSSSGSSSAKALRVDETAAPITYIGKAAPGSDPANPVWSIQRIDESTPGETIILFADGNSDEDNVWDDRVSLVYG